MPELAEAYYQEAGRAGRDGEPARAGSVYARPTAASSAASSAMRDSGRPRWTGARGAGGRDRSVDAALRSRSPATSRGQRRRRPRVARGRRGGRCRGIEPGSGCRRSPAGSISAASAASATRASAARPRGGAGAAGAADAMERYAEATGPGGQPAPYFGGRTTTLAPTGRPLDATRRPPRTRPTARPAARARRARRRRGRDRPHRGTAPSAAPGSTASPWPRCVPQKKRHAARRPASAFGPAPATGARSDRGRGGARPDSPRPRGRYPLLLPPGARPLLRGSRRASRGARRVRPGSPAEPRRGRAPGGSSSG